MRRRSLLIGAGSSMILPLEGGHSFGQEDWPDGTQQPGSFGTADQGSAFSSPFPGRTRISSVVLRYGTIMDAIDNITYANKRSVGPYGDQRGGDHRTRFDIPSHDYLKAVNVWVGQHQNGGPLVVKGLQLFSNKRESPVCGATDGRKYPVTADPGWQILGVYGTQQPSDPRGLISIGFKLIRAPRG
jgi:hypothetical protein